MRHMLLNMKNIYNIVRFDYICTVHIHMLFIASVQPTCAKAIQSSKLCRNIEMNVILCFRHTLFQTET